MTGKKRLMRREIAGRNSKRCERTYLHRVEGPSAYWTRLFNLGKVMDFDVRLYGVGRATASKEYPDEVVKVFVVDTAVQKEAADEQEA